MKAIRRLLCKLGFHRFRAYARQTYCLNNPSSGPLEFNTWYYTRCQCGAESGHWARSHYLNDDERAAPWGKYEIMKGGH